MSATIDINTPKSNHEAALLAIEKVLALLRSVQTMESTDKDGVEHLLEIAVETVRNDIAERMLKRAQRQCMVRRARR